MARKVYAYVEANLGKINEKMQRMEKKDNLYGVKRAEEEGT